MSIFNVTTEKLFVESYKAEAAVVKADKKAYGVTRAMLDAMYLEASEQLKHDSVTEEAMKLVRSALMAKMQNDKGWPSINDVKVGYQKGYRELGSVPCLVYNRYQSQIGQDIKRAKGADKLAKQIEQPNNTENKQPETSTPVDKTAQALTNFLSCFLTTEAAITYFTTHVIEAEK